MAWLLCVLVVCAAAQAEFVSAAWHVKLYESENAGVLTFTLVNENPSAVEQYRIETWSTHERGRPVRRSCAIELDRAQIAPHSTVTLPETCTLVPDPSDGRVLSYSSRIVSVGLANGWKWRAPVALKVVQ